MPTSFGPYEVVARVADGTTGTVYRARHTDLGREAAIKELSAALRDVPGLVARMRGEAEMLASLDDEHIVKVYDFVEEPDRVWIAEQWVDGSTLEQILSHHGSLTPEQSVGVIRGALMGLAHAHDKNLVHRDIAPTNIIADLNGTSMLVDFGLAAPVGGTGAQGTPAYMSPEAARGEPVIKASDVYSAAAVLYALLSGRPPYPGTDPATVIRQHAEAAPPTLSNHGPELLSLVTRSMDKVPANRPADAAAFLAELEAAAESRVGAGCPARASIPSIAAATTADVATGAGGAGVVGAAAGETVIVDAATLSTGGGASPGAAAASAAPRKILGLSVKQAVAAGIAAAVVVVGGGIVGANAYSDHQADVKADKAAAKKVAAQKAEAAKVKAFADGAPSGVWDLNTTITSTEFDGESVGQKESFVWTFDSTCEGYACSGTVKSSSGSAYQYAWDGKTLTVKPPPQESQTATCVDTVTGKETPGSSVLVTYRVAYAPFVANAGTPPSSMTSTVTVTASYSKYVNCNHSDPRKNVTKFVLTKQ